MRQVVSFDSYIHDDSFVELVRLAFNYLLSPKIWAIRETTRVVFFIFKINRVINVKACDKVKTID
ncbi:hypothetical protein BUZ67_01525 [Staphylococcus pasteuri]|nr:hypothetical protein BUZ66_02855 [Staphylococcus pasteuri]PTU86605.1 hypothetical protein BUZ67_01525 [Staphylococcus pasteuri]RIO37656.1 hypothetical protein BUZ65_01845 [Staphylococcus pasteuri]